MRRLILLLSMISTMNTLAQSPYEKTHSRYPIGRLINEQHLTLKK